jgi:4-hydroxy-tetrahydrodipicolinate reductase
MSNIRVCLAGATGWAGSELARGIGAAQDLSLVAAVSRSHAGKSLGALLGEPGLGAPVFASAADALAGPGCDVFVEFTRPASAKANILAALAAGAHVVVGTSGLTDTDYAEIDVEAQKRQRGVLACGNFALTAVLLQQFALMAAKVLSHWEIIDYGSATKVDAPSGTVRELVSRMQSQARPAQVTVAADRVIGPPEARGATVAGTQVHAVRLPGHVLGVDVIFGMPDQTLVLRHQAGTSAKPYVDGAVLAIRKVSGLVGLHRGLDSVLDA